MLRAATVIGLAVLGLVGSAAVRQDSNLASITDRAVLDSIASPAGPGSAEPFVAASPDGRVYMSWLEPADSGHALRIAALQGKQWSAPQTVRAGRDFFVNWADFPSIHVLGAGRLAVHWLQRNGRGTYAYGVRIAQSADGGRTWSEPVTPHRDNSPAEHGFVAMWSEAGKLGAVWLDGRKFTTEGHSAANEMMLVSTTIAPDGTLGPETRLDERTCDCCQNAAAVSAAGPIIAYRNRSTDEIRDIYVTRRVGGKWLPGAPVHADDWHIAACPVNGPAIAASGNRVAVAWFTAARDTARVKVAFSNDGGAKFDPPIRIDGGAPAGRVDLALLPDGSALVTWIERTGGEDAVVRTRWVSSSGRTGSPVTIASSSAARASGFPRMVVTGTDVVFAWTVPSRPSSIRVARARLAEFR
jgi:hypothetical protein